jgi:hypothetical protein
LHILGQPNTFLTKVSYSATALGHMRVDELLDDEEKPEPDGEIYRVVP